MPFITIEIPDSLHFAAKQFTLEMHTHIAKHLSVPIEKCKTKILRLPEVIVGSDDSTLSYARLKVECISGREKQLLIDTAKELLSRFQQVIQTENPKANCRITVEFHEIDRELLFAYEQIATKV